MENVCEGRRGILFIQSSLFSNKGKIFRKWRKACFGYQVTFMLHLWWIHVCSKIEKLVSFYPVWVGFYPKQILFWFCLLLFLTFPPISDPPILPLCKNYDKKMRRLKSSIQNYILHMIYMIYLIYMSPSFLETVQILKQGICGLCLQKSAENPRKPSYLCFLIIIYISTIQIYLDENTPQWSDI